MKKKQQKPGIKGHRIPDEDQEDGFLFSPGDYGKGKDGVWLCRPPNPEIHLGSLLNHEVTEHEDGTITAKPSIRIRQGDGLTWHGFLKKGIWTDA